jgi:hypothetical protein
MNYTDPDRKLPRLVSQRLSEAGKQQGLSFMAFGPGKVDPQPLTMKFLKERDAGGRFFVDLESDPTNWVIKDLDWKPAELEQAQDRLKRRVVLLNALLVNPCTSRNQREGHYIARRTPRKFDKYGKPIRQHTKMRTGPLVPKIVQFSLDAGKFDRLLLNKRNNMEAQDGHAQGKESAV